MDYCQNSPVFNVGLEKPQFSERCKRNFDTSIQARIYAKERIQPNHNKESPLSERSPLLDVTPTLKYEKRRDDKPISLPSLEKSPRSPNNDLAIKKKMVMIRQKPKVFECNISRICGKLDMVETDGCDFDKKIMNNRDLIDLMKDLESLDN